MTENRAFDMAIGIVESNMGVRRDSILSKRRPEHVSNARHALVWLLYDSFGIGKRTIAKLTNRDRGCPKNSLLRFEALMATNPTMRSVAAIMKRQASFRSSNDDDFEVWWKTSGEPAAKAIAATQWAASHSSSIDCLTTSSS